MEPNQNVQVLIHRQNTLEEIVSDHEKRLRFVERVVGYGLGALGAFKLLYDMIAHK